MKRLIIALLCLASVTAHAQQELAGRSLRIQPTPTMPRNLQGRLGFWSLSTGPTANHTLLHTIGGTDVDLDAGGGGGTFQLAYTGGGAGGGTFGLSASGGGFRIRDNATPLGVPLLSVESSGGSPYFSVTAAAAGATVLTLTDGASAPLSAAGSGSIAYDNTLKGFKGSADTGAFDVFATLAAAQTLTNKVINASVNTITNITSAMMTSTIAAGSCTSCNLTYDAAGRITVAANGSGGGGTVIADAPLSGNGSSGSHLSCPTCVVTGGSTMTGPFVLSGSQTGTYSLAGTPTLASALSIGTDSTNVGDATHRINPFALSLSSGASAMTFTSTLATGSSRAAFVFNDTNGTAATDKGVSLQVGGVEKGWLGYYPSSTTLYGFKSTIDAYFMNSAGNGITAQGTDISFFTNSTQTWGITGANLVPTADLSRSFGASGNRAAAVWARHYVGSQATAPTNTPGTGAGTSPTVSVTGSDSSGLISVLTGTAPSASASVVTVTFNAAWTAAPKGVVVSPANSASAALTGNAQVYVDNASTTTGVFVIKVGSTNLAATTTYLWQYVVIQ